MRKNIIALFLLSSAFVASTAMAAKFNEEVIRFQCPNTEGGQLAQRLTNFGKYITGMGTEIIGSSKKTLPVFHGVSSPGVPLNLTTGNYIHAGVAYNSHTGRVSCLFTSTSGADAFNVSYKADYLRHGYITKDDAAAITVVIIQG